MPCSFAGTSIHEVPVERIHGACLQMNPADHIDQYLAPVNAEPSQSDTGATAEAPRRLVRIRWKQASEPSTWVVTPRRLQHTVVRCDDRRPMRSPARQLPPQSPASLHELFPDAERFDADDESPRVIHARNFSVRAYRCSSQSA